MARANKLYEKPRVTSLATGDLFTIGQLQADGSYKVKTITRENARAELLAPIEIEYDDLVALSGSFDTEVSYMITNATSASFNLIVKAVSASEIGCDAKDPLYPNDVVKYNFASNVITWRWDTVNDISAGEDWRNSNNIQIGANCTHIEIGEGCEVTLGAGCTRIKIGNLSKAVIGTNGTDITIGNDSGYGTLNTIGNSCGRITIGNDVGEFRIISTSQRIKIGDGCEIFSVGAASSDVSIGYGCNIVVGGAISACTIGNQVGISIDFANKNLTSSVFGNSVGISANDSIQDLLCYYSADLTASTFVYSLGQTKTIQRGNGGAARLIYLDNTNTLVNVDAEA